VRPSRGVRARMSDLSQIGFYTSLDTRPGFLTSLGLPEPAVVTEESDGEAFYATVSSEEADRFADVDVFVTYGDASGSIIPQLQADPLLSQIPAIAEGRIAILEESTPLAASANPSPLSIGWGIEEYFALLAGALD
jgi:iron complex transport system substrate-binding protein